MPRLNQVDINKPAQNLSHFLNHRTRQRGRTGCPSLPCCQQQYRHTTFYTRLQHPAGVFRKAHRRNDKATGTTHKGSLPPRVLTTGDQLKHIDGLVHVGGVHEACANMLGSARDRGITGIEIHLGRIFDIP